LTQQLSTLFKNTARQFGFAAAGITDAGRPRHWETYHEWVKAQRHAGMSYLATERALTSRADPQLLLEGCRSILVVAAEYPRSAAFPTGEALPPLSGRVASYAWQTDYHITLPLALAGLMEFVQQKAGAIPHRIYTDTGPILEKDLAQRAGLGWIGKNGCLIHPQKGSYLLLAEVLLGIEMEPDPPFAFDHCGTCTRCIEACPTSCIRPDRTLEAGRCIAYLTIEAKGAIPVDLRKAIGDWVFGCDICQQVCPWNHRLSPGFPLILNLTDVLALTPEGFSQNFRQSPLARPRRRGLLRNAAIALGNSAAPGGVELLLQALGDAEPLVRGHAAWGVGQKGGAAALKGLDNARLMEDDPWVFSEIEKAIESLGNSH
jgi:epoxyqueuosine reductase